MYFELRPLEKLMHRILKLVLHIILGLVEGLDLDDIHIS